jgi:uncharacterized protein (DUF1778 family)
MSTIAQNDARISFRLPKDLKHIIERAASESGQSVSEFAVSSLVRSAREVIDHGDRTILSNRDRDIFLKLLSDVDADPNESLLLGAED